MLLCVCVYLCCSPAFQCEFPEFIIHWSYEHVTLWVSKAINTWNSSEPSLVSHKIKMKLVSGQHLWPRGRKNESNGEGNLMMAYQNWRELSRRSETADRHKAGLTKQNTAAHHHKHGMQTASQEQRPNPQINVIFVKNSVGWTLKLFETCDETFTESGKSCLLY